MNYSACQDPQSLKDTAFSLQTPCCTARAQTANSRLVLSPGFSLTVPFDSPLTKPTGTWRQRGMIGVQTWRKGRMRGFPAELDIDPFPPELSWAERQRRGEEGVWECLESSRLSKGNTVTHKSTSAFSVFTRNLLLVVFKGRLVFFWYRLQRRDC